MTILYVEDDETLGHLVKRRINKLGYDIDLAADCATAMQYLEQNTYLLIIIDYQLPDGTGIDLLKKLRERGGSYPTIMVSGQDDIRIAVEALNLGCMDYLVKDGLGYLELLPVHINSVLEHQQLKQQKQQAEAETAKAEDSLARAQRLAHIGSWEWNIGDTAAWWSDEHFAIFGLEKSDSSLVDIDTFHNSVHRDDLQSVLIEHQKAFSGKDAEFEYRIVLPEGQIRWLHAIDFVEFDDGTPTRCYGTIQDITERKRSEKQLDLAQRVFNNTTEAIMVSDANKIIVSVNPAFTQITGYEESEVIGQSIVMLRSDDENSQVYEEVWRDIDLNGYWVGELWHKNKSGQSYPEWLSITAIHNLSGEVEHYISIFSDITEHKKAKEIIEYQANFDGLTGLPNRNLFNDRLSSLIKYAERDKHKLALLFLDLDRFKWVNDTLGHSAGDQLLIETGKRLTSVIRESDTLSRLGGDEFTVVLSNLTGGIQAEVVAEKIIHKLSQPYIIDDNEVYVSASVGITIYPDDAVDEETLFKNADTAMYEAKERGRNCFSFFTEKMQHEAERRLSLLNELQNAIKNGHFELYYQPIMHAKTAELYGAEALLRWPHPQLGFISPDSFIPLSEETGLIHPLGHWVMVTALTQLKNWQDRNVKLNLSMNKSSRQFHTGDCADDLYKTIVNLGVNPSMLTVEITETVLIEQKGLMADLLEKYRNLGIKMSLDDFGTGYSSLNYLRQFPFDVLKIDRSFVRDILTNSDNATLVKTIIVMGHNLGLTVLAEGVESEQQREFLIEAGCDLIQGFLYSPALPASEFETKFLNL